jgi:protein-S-isoprenylcysteine O-methyltransferase Ste14
MRNETRFRVILGAMGAVGTVIRLYYMRKASRSGQISRKREERLRIALIASCNALGMIGGLVYVLAPQRMKWATLPLPTWSRWVGAGLAAVGAPLLLWTHHSLGKNWSATVEIRGEQTLVTSGPYRWVRHPMYTAFFVNGLATLLVSANWVIGGGWLGQGIVAATRVGDEEALMIEEFGDQYRAYMQHTGTFLPRIALKLTPQL